VKKTAYVSDLENVGAKYTLLVKWYKQIDKKKDSQIIKKI